jgi:hypothetical protein
MSTKTLTTKTTAAAIFDLEVARMVALNAFFAACKAHAERNVWDENRCHIERTALILAEAALKAARAAA